VPHSQRKRVLREQARGSGKGYAQLLGDSGKHNSVRIHPAKPSDLPRFFTGSAPPDMSRLWQLHDLLQHQELGLGRLFVASTANASIGYLFVKLEQDPAGQGRKRDVPLLTYYWVRESRRRTGVGTRLVKGATRWLHQDGHGKVAAAVDPSDTDAARLYVRLDFSPSGEIESYRDEFQPDGKSNRVPMALAIYIKRY
jgi:GNAT superfamily N-acetyltransferase